MRNYRILTTLLLKQISCVAHEEYVIDANVADQRCTSSAIIRDTASAFCTNPLLKGNAFLPRCIVCTRSFLSQSCRFVCPFVTHVNCNKTNESSARHKPYERSIHLVFRHEKWLVRDVPFYLKFWAKRAPLPQKRRFPIDICSCTLGLLLSTLKSLYSATFGVAYFNAS